MLKNLQILVLITIFFPFLNSCGTGGDAKQFPPDPKERVKKNLEEGRGFTIMGGVKGRGGSGDFDFASSNELWRASLDTIDFMPLASANYSGGIIITDWYSSGSNNNERCKLNIFITGTELKTQNLKVTSFCQEFVDQKWINKSVDAENNIKIENAILNKAKKLRLESS